MSGLIRPEVPFAYRNKGEFGDQLANWIGHVFYDVLPQHGYEIREEQISTAFQIAHAVCRQKVHLAEAGLGTGKTFAYLLTAVSYARLMGKPFVIACASTALQEQLAGVKGDAASLSRMLSLDVDVRMAKDPRQYLCDVKVNGLKHPLPGQVNRVPKKVLDWAAKTLRGERSEVPDIPDRVWKQVAWDETMYCETCSSRGFCKLVKAREDYRQAGDLIVCDHGIFFDDLWTREERIADGRLALLPAYSGVILDEGHKVILPAAMRAGRMIEQEEIDSMLIRIERIQGARTSLLSTVVAVDAANFLFFKTLGHSVTKKERTDRLTVQISDHLLDAADTMRRALDKLYFELQNEQELRIQSLSATRLKAFETRVENAVTALNRFCANRGNEAIVWVDRADGGFWVVPRNLSNLLKQHLFEKKLPVVFSSATLSNGGDFSYFSRLLRLPKPSSSSVGSSFEFKTQLCIYLPQDVPHGDAETWFPMALKRLVLLLRLSRGRALVLTNTPSEVERIRKGLKEYPLPFEVFWEDQAERGYLVRRFREEVSSVLVGSVFWEGIDVPGEALSLLVIWRLPFPASDPLIEAQRREAIEQGLDPVTTVDFPEMGLKLKQGCGRVIRTREDRGVIAILGPVLGMPWEHVVMEALPAGAVTVGRMDKLSILKSRAPLPH